MGHIRHVHLTSKNIAVPSMTAALFIFMVMLIGVSLAELQCRDEDNNPVDWYVLYKLPRTKQSSHNLIKKGLAYAYITSQNVSKGWILSEKSINDSQSMPGLTLQNLYHFTTDKQADPLLWIQYNDQPPQGATTSQLGHTKGVLMTNESGGFWLVHSVPHFPPSPNSTMLYSYPLTGTHYGQSFLCISLNSSQIDLVGIQLQYNEPKIYDSRVPSELQKQFPNLVAAAEAERVKTAPWYHEQELFSLAGQKFFSFAKAGKFEKELYYDWIAPTLQISLLVESWLNGAGKLSSNCNGTFIVENISSLKLKAAGIKFKSSHDHSKWAVAEKDSDDAKDWVCVGDINRMENQETRGGGTVCINHYKLWPAYRQLIDTVDPCPRRQ